MAKKKKRGNFLIREYKESWNYLKNLKNFVFAIILMFLVSAIIGYFIFPPEAIYNQILDYIEELLKLTAGKSLFELMTFIFFNNFKSSLFGIFFGVFFGIFPVIAILANGYFLGFVSRLVVNEEGLFVLWRLAPHGIFELPAIFISFALGLKLGSFVFEKDKKQTLINYLRNSLRVFLYIVLPLLIIAAIIESTLIFIS